MPCILGPRWGFLRGHPGLRGLHGFESNRLPGSGAQAVGRALAAAAAERFASTPWIDPEQYTDPAGEAALGMSAHLVDPGGSAVPPWGLRGTAGMCGAGGGDQAGDEGGLCEAGLYWGAEGEGHEATPERHLANAVAALALITVPLIGDNGQCWLWRAGCGSCKHELIAKPGLIKGLNCPAVV
jgi:hypothetical protein